MKKHIKNIVYACLSVFVIFLIPLFLSKGKPLPADIPVVDIQSMLQQKEQEEKEAKVAAERAAAREAVLRAFQCEVDEDCIIVSRDPCGCLIGPQGVTAVNAASALVFTSQEPQTKACPETAPSTEAQCSPTAQAVCWKNKCTIVY